MRRLTPFEVRFMIKRGLQSLSRSIIRDLGGKPEARERALDLATSVLEERFDRHHVAAPDVKALDFRDMKNG